MKTLKTTITLLILVSIVTLGTTLTAKPKSTTSLEGIWRSPVKGVGELALVATFDGSYYLLLPGNKPSMPLKKAKGLNNTFEFDSVIDTGLGFNVPVTSMFSLLNSGKSLLVTFIINGKAHHSRVYHRVNRKKKK